MLTPTELHIFYLSQLITNHQQVTCNCELDPIQLLTDSRLTVFYCNFIGAQSLFEDSNNTPKSSLHIVTIIVAVERYLNGNIFQRSLIKMTDFL